VADARRDFHHQLSTRLIRDNQAIAVEDLCEVKDGPKPLHVRAWRCQGCGAWLDRDINAAVNVARAAGLAVQPAERR
jgi:putative transposase